MSTMSVVRENSEAPTITNALRLPLLNVLQRGPTLAV